MRFSALRHERVQQIQKDTMGHISSINSHTLYPRPSFSNGHLHILVGATAFMKRHICSSFFDFQLYNTNFSVLEGV